MKDTLNCSVCNFDYSHLITTIEVNDNDEYETTEFVINSQHRIPAKIDYLFRTQGNIHLLFRCEEGHFFIKSFDGHKGNVFIDENPLMDDLVAYLNVLNKEPQNLTSSWNLSFGLLGQIETFLKTQETLCKQKIRNR